MGNSRLRKPIIGAVSLALAAGGFLLSPVKAAPLGGIGGGIRASHPIRILPQAATKGPTGLTPAKVKAAYNFPTALDAGAGQTIAIVDPYDHPNIEADLAVFSTAFGLPQCTTANGCFKKVDQTGGSRLPKADAEWAMEIALDVQWAHAIAPGAHILLVEAIDNGIDNLMIADLFASTQADYISNSWGTDEFKGQTAYGPYLTQAAQGASIFISSGDTGVPSWPATHPSVISVGGTTLKLSAAGAVTAETGWSGSGGGCSRYELANPAQVLGTVSCAGKRGTPDISLVADPATGVSVYNSYKGKSGFSLFGGGAATGWLKVGGTSASAPMLAGRAAARTSQVPVDASLLYGSAITYRDIATGKNRVASCRAGYDLVTGRGSWLG